MKKMTYVMSYFRTQAEALHLAVSEDGLTWDAVLGGKPIYWSPVGEKSIRDPFVCRAGDGRFHLLSTNSWKSDSIVHAVSDDLLTWTDAVLLPLMASVPGVRNTWAPEAFWDMEESVWRLVWSSSTADENTPSDQNHRIWSSATRDFASFTSPALFFDPGYSVIDACVVRRDSDYLMAFKDERGHNPPRHTEPGQRKAICIATSPTATGPWTEVTDLITPPFTEGPTLYRRGGKWVMAYDLFVAHAFGALASRDGIVWEPLEEPVSFPSGARHASVMEVPDEIGRRLLRG